MHHHNIECHQRYFLDSIKIIKRPSEKTWYFSDDPLGLFIGIAIIGNLCSFVQAFDQRERLFDIRYRIQHFAVDILVLYADEDIFASLYPPTIGSEFESFDIFSAFFSI